MSDDRTDEQNYERLSNLLRAIKGAAQCRERTPTKSLFLRSCPGPRMPCSVRPVGLASFSTSPVVRGSWGR